MFKRACRTVWANHLGETQGYPQKKEGETERTLSNDCYPCRQSGHKMFIFCIYSQYGLFLCFFFIFQYFICRPLESDVSVEYGGIEPRTIAELQSFQPIGCISISKISSSEGYIYQTLLAYVSSRLHLRHWLTSDPLGYSIGHLNS